MAHEVRIKLFTGAMPSQRNGPCSGRLPGRKKVLSTNEPFFQPQSYVKKR